MIDNVRIAIIGYQHSERLKSELMIASQLIGEIETAEVDDVHGAVKIVSSYLTAVLSETRVAYNSLGSTILLEADRKILESIKNVESANYAQANRCLAEAISAVTTLANEALRFLIDHGLMN